MQSFSLAVLQSNQPHEPFRAPPRHENQNHDTIHPSEITHQCKPLHPKTNVSPYSSLFTQSKPGPEPSRNAVKNQDQEHTEKENQEHDQEHDQDQAGTTGTTPHQ